jgi:hypothetical protein
LSRAFRSDVSKEKSPAEIGSSACFAPTIARLRNHHTVCSRPSRKTASSRDSYHRGDVRELPSM